jgi:hypothetical protein
VCLTSCEIIISHKTFNTVAYKSSAVEAWHLSSAQCNPHKGRRTKRCFYRVCETILSDGGAFEWSNIFAARFAVNKKAASQENLATLIHSFFSPTSFCFQQPLWTLSHLGVHFPLLPHIKFGRASWRNFDRAQASSRFICTGVGRAQSPRLG